MLKTKLKVSKLAIFSKILSCVDFFANKWSVRFSKENVNLIPELEKKTPLKHD